MNNFLSELQKATRSSLSTVGDASKQRLEERQAKKDLQKLYWKLGKEVVALVEAGELDHPILQKRRARILKQLERIAAIRR